MSFFKHILGDRKKRTGSAELAKERIRLVLVREEGGSTKLDFMPQLQKELIEVITKYVEINEKDIHITNASQESLELLEVKIEMDPQRIKK